MNVEELPEYLKQAWPEIWTSILEETYKPKPVKVVNYLPTALVRIRMPGGVRGRA